MLGHSVFWPDTFFFFFWTPCIFKKNGNFSFKIFFLFLSYAVSNVAIQFKDSSLTLCCCPDSNIKKRRKFRLWRWITAKRFAWGHWCINNKWCALKSSSGDGELNVKSACPWRKLIYWTMVQFLYFMAVWLRPFIPIYSIGLCFLNFFLFLSYLKLLYRYRFLLKTIIFAYFTNSHTFGTPCACF